MKENINEIQKSLAIPIKTVDTDYQYQERGYYRSYRNQTSYKENTMISTTNITLELA